MRGPVHRLGGFVTSDHELSVPLDHAEPEGEQITVFAREVVAAGREDDELPWLLFLQGGPGSEAPRPPGPSKVWLERATRDYRVLLLDQRGTGRSSPLLPQTLARFAPEEQARRLALFRADAIVRDAELVRRELIGDEPWSVLGQSFGGFCTVTYLSFAAEGLREALITGGLPPLDGGPDPVYRATYERVAAKNRRWYERLPDDAERVREIVQHLETNDVRLPDGDRLTARRFRQRGMALGASDGAEKLHYLVEHPFVDGELDMRFVRAAFENGFETNPLYAVLHEPCYCQGEAPRWSAARILDELPEFALDADPVLLTGEMVYPWMFDEYRELRPLKEAAEILAAKDDWPPLYDPAALVRNTVPCAAAIYYDDMYVVREFSEQTAGGIRGLRVWVTNEFEHDGLRVDERVLDRLLELVRE